MENVNVMEMSMVDFVEAVLASNGGFLPTAGGELVFVEHLGAVDQLVTAFVAGRCHLVIMVGHEFVVGGLFSEAANYGCFVGIAA